MIEKISTFSISQTSLETRSMEYSKKSSDKAKDTITSPKAKSSKTFWGKVKSFFLKAWNWFKFRFLCCFFSDEEHRKAVMIEEMEAAQDKVFFATSMAIMMEQEPEKALKIISEKFDELSKESQEKIKEEMLQVLKEVNFKKLSIKSKEVVKDSLFNVLKEFNYDSFSSKVKAVIKKDAFESWKDKGKAEDVKDAKTQVFSILKEMETNEIEKVCKGLVTEIIRKNPHCDIEFKNEDGEGRGAYLIFSEAIVRVLNKMKSFTVVNLPE